MGKIKIETERVAVSGLGSDVTEMAIKEHTQHRANQGWTLRAIATLPDPLGLAAVPVLCLVFAKKVRV